MRAHGLLAVRLTVALIAAACALIVFAGVCASAGGADGAEPQRSASDQGAVVDTYVASASSVPGLAVLVSSMGGTVIERYYDASDGTGATVGPETVFEWGRCADLIVWTCVMQLVEDGQLALSDEVAQLLGDLSVLPEGYEGLTVADLMDHTAGLDVAMTGSKSTIDPGSASTLPAFDLFDVEGDRSPGEAVAYTPYDALLAAAAVEAVSGTDFCTYAEQNVIEPLGLTSVELTVGGKVDVPAVAAQSAADAPSWLFGSGLKAPSSASSTVFTCTGTAKDLVGLAEAIMCSRSDDAEVFAPSTSRLMFTVTRTYPSLGIARVAHGMFAFPLSSGVYGLSASTASDSSVGVYMNRAEGFAVVVAANEAQRFDLVQGIPRVLVGRSDALAAQSAGPAEATWAGTYQNASEPDHGPTKLLTALNRTRVGTNERGTLTFDGLTATSLGAGVYSIDTAKDQDVYRFHVNLERGSEYSRATSDFVIVPSSTLAVEQVLLFAAAASVVICLAYVAFEGARVLSARFHHRRPPAVGLVVLLAVLTCAAPIGAYVALASIAGGTAASVLDVWLVLEALYVVVAVVLGAWTLFVRVWPNRLGPLRRAADAAVVLAALAVVTNLVYWEMLP